MKEPLATVPRQGVKTPARVGLRIAVVVGSFFVFIFLVAFILDYMHGHRGRVLVRGEAYLTTSVSQAESTVPATAS